MEKKSVTDTIEFIFHKDKPKYRRSTYVRAVCGIRPLKTETNITIPTGKVNHIDYTGEVNISASNLTNMKLHVISAISDVQSRYMCMNIKDF